MYIENAIYKNVGPIDKAEINFSFEKNGNPKPIILVGENGSGKSTLLSNIVDSFYEMAGTAFNNARHSTDNNDQQYYKAISNVQIKTGNKFMYTYIRFNGEHQSEYLCTSGDITVKNVIQELGISNSKFENYDNNGNFKKVTISKEQTEKEWETNVICYFGPDRYEKPEWLGEKYYIEEENLHLSIYERFSGKLDKPISIKNVTSSNLQWLLDVIADSRPDVMIENDKFTIINVIPDDLKLLGKARNNLELLLSEILEEDVYFSLNYRNNNKARFRILRRKDDSIVAPTLSSLSTGQIALFNIFSTIIRYADINDINKSIRLSDIKGIVVIDEIELHIHTKLQKEVLPKLMKLFPKIQFVITTHAPLFLLGMKDIYGEDHFVVIELPESRRITTERFSGFLRAYSYLKETEIYQKEAEKALYMTRHFNNPIIITEGSTDWKHLKAALNGLKTDETYKDILGDINFNFFEFEDENSESVTKTKLKMGNSVLCQLCENMAKLPQPVKYIFIADRDDPDTNKKLSIPDKEYKDWGNNVYSFILPVPEHRKDTPSISIEHYYTDDEIKTELYNSENIPRRLYIGNEFDERGIANDIDRYCEKRNKCGKTSIAIIEGSKGEKVTSIKDNNGINYALPKSVFANMILDRQKPFDDFKFDSFIDIYKIIKHIIDE